MSNYKELVERLHRLAEINRRIFQNFGLQSEDADTMDRAADAIENLQNNVKALQVEIDRLHKENFWLTKES